MVIEIWDEFNTSFHLQKAIANLLKVQSKSKNGRIGLFLGEIHFSNLSDQNNCIAGQNSQNDEVFRHIWGLLL